MNRASWWYRLSCAVFPERCALCYGVVRPGERYCAACRREIPPIQAPRCVLCGTGKDRCTCRKRRHAYDGLACLFYYEGRMRRYFPHIKKPEHTVAAVTLAEDLAALVREMAFPADCIAAVPGYRTWWRKPFNASQMLAQELGKELAKPVLPLLTKTAYTAPQKTLSALERTGNLLGVFDVTSALTPAVQTVLLVDDIKTTGSTLNECAKMLKLYGVRRVYAVTVGCTVQPKPDVKTEVEHGYRD